MQSNISLKEVLPQFIYFRNEYTQILLGQTVSETVKLTKIVNECTIRIYARSTSGANYINIFKYIYRRLDCFINVQLFCQYCKTVQLAKKREKIYLKKYLLIHGEILSKFLEQVFTFLSQIVSQKKIFPMISNGQASKKTEYNNSKQLHFCACRQSKPMKCL